MTSEMMDAGSLIGIVIGSIFGFLFLVTCVISAVKAVRDRKKIKARIALRQHNERLCNHHESSHTNEISSSMSHQTMLSQSNSTEPIIRLDCEPRSGRDMKKSRNEVPASVKTVTPAVDQGQFAAILEEARQSNRQVKVFSYTLAAELQRDAIDIETISPVCYDFPEEIYPENPRPNFQLPITDMPSHGTESVTSDIDTITSPPLSDSRTPNPRRARGKKFGVDMSSSIDKPRRRQHSGERHRRSDHSGRSSARSSRRTSPVGRRDHCSSAVPNGADNFAFELREKGQQYASYIGQEIDL